MSFGKPLVDLKANCARCGRSGRDVGMVYEGKAWFCHPCDALIRRLDHILQTAMYLCRIGVE
jgi:hypothetical protein